MAKRQVNLIEQHLEKAVLGITVVVLGAVVFLYLIRTPNGIEERGELLGPGDYDKEVVLQKAEQIKAFVARPAKQPTPVKDYAREFRLEQDNPLGRVEGVNRWHPVQPYRPLVPPAVGSKPVEPGQILLARVVPPEKPVVSVGFSTFETLPRAPIDAPPLSENEYEGSVREEDMSWVLVSAEYNLENQRQELRRAYYDSELQEILVYQTRTQRQTLQPGGYWGEWEDITAWSPYYQPELPVIQLSPRGDGYMLPAAQLVILKNFRDLIWERQPELKQPLPPLDIAGTKWRLPALPEIDWDTLDLRPDEEPPYLYLENLPRPEAASTADSSGSSKSGAQFASEERKRGAREFKEAEELAQKPYKLQALLKADKLIKSIQKNSHAVKRIKEKADKLYAQFLPEIDRLMEEAEKEASDQPAQPSGIPPLKQEQAKTVVWVHDMPVQAGRTYRYRLAVDLINTYAGNYAKLLDMKSATSMLVRGGWSVPSNPVEVGPETAFFLTGAGEDGARIEIYKWFRGKMAKTSIKIQPGQSIADRGFRKIRGEAGRAVVDFDTGYTLLSVEREAPYRVREAQGRSGAFQYREESTPAITCVDRNGLLIRRSRLENQDEQREWGALFKKNKIE